MDLSQFEFLSQFIAQVPIEFQFPVVTSFSKDEWCLLSSQITLLLSQGASVEWIISLGLDSSLVLACLPPQSQLSTPTIEEVVEPPKSLGKSPLLESLGASFSQSPTELDQLPSTQETAIESTSTKPSKSLKQKHFLDLKKKFVPERQSSYVLDISEDEADIKDKNEIKRLELEKEIERLSKLIHAKTASKVNSTSSVAVAGPEQDTDHSIVKSKKKKRQEKGFSMEKDALMKLAKDIVQREEIMEKTEKEIIKCCSDLSNLNNTIAVNNSLITSYQKDNEYAQEKIKKINQEISDNNSKINALMLENKDSNSTKKEFIQLLESQRLSVIELKVGLKDTYTQFIESKTLLERDSSPKRIKLEGDKKGPIKDCKLSDDLVMDAPANFDLSFVDQIITNVESLYLKRIEAKKRDSKNISCFNDHQTIRILLDIDGILTDQVDLNLPSYQMELLSGQVTWEKVKLQNSSQLKAEGFFAPSQFKPYVPVLDKYRSLRQSTVEANFGPHKLEHKLDPFRDLCVLEILKGKCTKKACASQHLRELNISENENDLVKDLILKIAELCSTEQLIIFTRQLRTIIGKKVSRRDFIEFLYEFERNQIVGCSEEHTESLDANVDISLDTVKADLSNNSLDIQIDLPTSMPILLQGLYKILTEEASDKRYYESLSSEVEFERKLEKSPNDIELWIEYAISQLPPLTHDSLELRSSNNLHKLLNVLSKALKNNRFSASLWNFYMEFYVRRGKEKDIRRMFDQALGFLKNDIDFCWRYYSWEKEIQGRRNILNHMLDQLVQDNLRRDSYNLLNVLVQLVQLALENEGYGKTIIFFDRIVSCETVEELYQNTTLKKIPIAQTFVRQKLSADHFVTLWLLYCHLRYFSSLSSETFQSFPYDYLIKGDYFVIDWNVEINTCPKAVKNFILRSMTNLLKSFKGNTSLQHFHIALIKNMLQFQKQVIGHYDNFFLDYVKNLSLKFDNNPELYMIMFEMDEARHNQIEFLDETSRAFVANCLAQKDSSDKAALRLVNFIRSCFEDVGPVDKADLLVVQEAIELYKSALSQSGQHVSNKMIKKNIHVRSKFFVWLNYLLLTAISWEMLEESLSGFSNYFHEATESIKDNNGRILMHIEYLKTFSKKKIRNFVLLGDLLNILNNALTDIQACSKNILLKKTMENQFLHPIRLMDTNFTDKLLNASIDALKFDKSIDMLDLLGNLKSVCLPLPFVEMIFKKDVKYGMQALWHNIRLNPKNYTYWKMAIKLCNNTIKKEEISALATNFVNPKLLEKT